MVSESVLTWENQIPTQSKMLIACPGSQKLDCLNVAQWFTSLDLKAIDWQVELDEDSKLLTAFTVRPLGFCECDRIPFGMTNVPTTFQ